MPASLQRRYSYPRIAGGVPFFICMDCRRWRGSAAARVSIFWPTEGGSVSPSDLILDVGFMVMFALSIISQRCIRGGGRKALRLYGEDSESRSDYRHCRELMNMTSTGIEPTWEGRSMAAWYMLRETPPGVDPLGPDNMMIFAEQPHCGCTGGRVQPVDGLRDAHRSPAGSVRRTRADLAGRNSSLPVLMPSWLRARPRSRFTCGSRMASVRYAMPVTCGAC